MIRLALLIWVALATQAAAAVLVKAGEHDGFTRLVVDYGKPVQWQVGRAEDGYELRVEGTQPAYDFSDSFKIIGTGRLVSLTTDSSNGDLRIGVACKCYAIPFEFRDGIIVIDLRDGAPPKGSSFEVSLEPAQSAAPDHQTTPDPAPEPAPVAGAYDWTASAVAKAGGQPLQMPTVPQNQQANLDGLRETLIGQLSRGATQGIIELTPPEPAEIAGETAAPKDAALPEDPVPVAPAAPPEAGLASVRSGLGELPSISVTSGSPSHENLGAKGETCVAAEALDLAAWRGEGEVFDQMQRATQNLIGEFDRPDPEAVKAAIQFDLSIGFGIEAKQLMRAFPLDLQEFALWDTMADLVDGNPTSSVVFQGQMNCDTPAALWAVLGNAAVAKGDFVNKGAVYLAFSGLPIDLRRSLGLVLADRFLALGDAEMASKLRDAVLRAPGIAGPQMTLLDASIDMHSGQPGAAEHKILSVFDDPGPSSSDATIALIEAKVAQNLPVDADFVAILAAMVQESDDTPAAAPTRRALALAQAASGDFDAAFASAESQPELTPILWRLLARLGDDDAVLAHAVLDPQAQVPASDSDSRLTLASRLSGLGMAAASAQWLSGEAAVDPILAATVNLQKGNANGSLDSLKDLDTPEALALRAKAVRQLGDDKAAAQIFTQIGDAASAQQATARAQDWQTLQQTGSGDWQTAARATAATPLPEGAQTVATAPLAYGKSLLDQTTATRAAVSGLLSQVAQP